MTIQATTDRVTHGPGDGSEATYSYPFKVFDETDLLLVKITDAGVPTTLVLTTDYTVDPTGIGVATGGEITLNSNLESGYYLLIERLVTPLQEADFPTAGKFSPVTHETTFDFLTMAILMLYNLIRPDDYSASRILMLGRTDTSGSGSFDANGNRVSNAADPTSAQDLATKAYVDTSPGGLSLDTVYDEQSSPPTATSSSPVLVVSDAGDIWCKVKSGASTYEYILLREGI